MAIHGFLERHRGATRVLTPIALGVALLVVLTWALWSAPPRTMDTALTASTTDCHDMVTLSIAGRGDTPRSGTTKMLVDANGRELPAASADDYVSDWIDQASNAPLKAVAPGSYAAMYIAYPADMASYENAVTTGVANTESVIKAIRASCPDTKFAIVGYSEGADVARRVAMNVGHQDASAEGGYGIVDPANVVGVVILADAGRAEGQGPFPGAKNPFTNPDGFDVKYQNGRNPVPGQGVTPDTGGSDFGALAGRIASFCSDGDLTCAAPQNISLLQLVVNVGRQLNIDALEREQLTPATGIDVATVLSRIALDAFAHIQAQPDWMQNDETFLDVLLTVSNPSYTRPTAPPTTTTKQSETGTDNATTDSDISTPVSGETDSIQVEKMSPLAYLPQKLFKEIVGLIVTNQNTIPVIMSDPYQLTLGPDVGHHFDYWRDADQANGKPLTSADYAAAWLTHLAKQAQNGQQVNAAAKPGAAELAAALNEVTSSAAPSSTAPSPGTPSSAQPSASAGQPPAATTAASPTPQAPAPATTPEVVVHETTTAATEGVSSPADASTSAPQTTTVAPTTTSGAVPTPSG
ncbi:cutinase family protein [Rhodococcus hoagii]|uniref:Secreted cutinase n=1 Tax=Rhodococcus hoagii (strain 103S) TaxID=685727 RepID=A0A3S5YDC9_RHOH1|nr:cutinase family protein [Prescottella equi]NKR88713.1 cutinase family protein [Prescottella equi]NKS07405.1 cutinase family protein [Prescottella equi]NKS93584.1 cutinase family protein [Prescottella equi]NKT10960.1 cutinase family protein [Prescottella equi]NKT16595.1 cutinase family protein [Prescottella equi]